MGGALLGGLYFVVLGARSDPASIGHAFSVTMLAVAGCHLIGAALGAGLGQKRRPVENALVLGGAPAE